MSPQDLPQRLDLPRRAIALVLAGGRGSRPQHLTDRRAKSAVYFGGKFRIVDFALPNCLNSGTRRTGVITRYKSHSLLRHLQRGWAFLKSDASEFVDLLPAQQRMDRSAGTEARPTPCRRSGTSSTATAPTTWSTPAASCVMRARGAYGGIILSASHNPGGPDGNFGIKYNSRNCGPAPEKLTEASYRHTQAFERYLANEADDIDLARLGTTTTGDTCVEVIDPVADHSALMAMLFDFPAIARLLARHGFRVCFDAMNAVTGPYACAILVQGLGAPTDSVMNGASLPDFGGGHPDPNPTYAAELVANMFAHDAPMPTSAAVDRVAQALGIPCYETAIGWKFFGNLLDAGLITLSGEESAGTVSNHVREKDGQWVMLLWLHIVAVRSESVEQILHSHWRCFGRAVIASADDFAYTDPVDGSVSTGQGVRIVSTGGPRIGYRHRGRNAARLPRTLRGRPGASRHRHAGGARQSDGSRDLLAGTRRRTGRAQPTVIT